MNLALMMRLASKYIWWKPGAQAVSQPDRVAAQVMELGDWDDVMLLRESEGDDFLRQVLLRAEAGQFSERSWNYWNLRLGLGRPGNLPPMPTRHFA
ncbi:MAG TPA: hypothetical protein VL593_00075 [Ramlibacter sp.]|jgi:hypothetical protein|nr:hypothetical protein [Ramlibacter sp.]